MSGNEGTDERELAWRLLRAEIEDILTVDGTIPGQGYQQSFKEIAKRGIAVAGYVLIETAAIAGEAIIRLAALRDEDPQVTVEWLQTTERAVEWLRRSGTEESPHDVCRAQGEAAALVRCDCGNERIVTVADLASGRVTSCGEC